MLKYDRFQNVNEGKEKLVEFETILQHPINQA